jgi:hypothetical protein
MTGLTRQNGRLTSIRIARQKLALNEEEKRTLAAWEAVRAGKSHRLRNGIDLAAHLQARVETPGLDAPDAERLRVGLAALAGSQFSLTGTQPGTAVPLVLGDGPVDRLVDALESEDIAATLDLALNAVPETHWSIEAMLGAILKPAQNRLPVGHGLLEEIHESQAALSL